MKSNKILLPFSLFCIYYLQGILYASGSIVSQGILLIYLLIGLKCANQTISNKCTPRCLILWGVLFVMQAICFVVSPKEVNGTINEAIGRVATFNQFKEISIFILTLMIGYYYSCKASTSPKQLFWIGLAFFGLSVVQYAYASTKLLIEYGRETTNNAGYFVLIVVPYLPIILKRNKLLGIALVVIAVGLIMWSAKRGALVCLLASALYSLVYYLKRHRVRVKTIVGIAVMLTVAGYFIYSQFMENEYLQYRLEATMEGKSSNRDVAYSQLFNHWLNETNPLLFLFGNGTAQTISVWGNYGHNDWLELLIDNGLIGAVLYFAIFVSTISYIKKAKLLFEIKLSAYLCVLILFMQSCFSMGFTSGGNGILVFLLGIIIGNNENEKREARIYAH